LKARRISCSKCGAATEYSLRNQWRPFCSERCRMIDLGKWAAEEYRLPEKDEEAASPPSSRPPES
jgi:endogenous inhibitor of DNA gyrase (YacG/DUF329 family)